MTDWREIELLHRDDVRRAGAALALWLQGDADGWQTIGREARDADRMEEFVAAMQALVADIPTGTPIEHVIALGQRIAREAAMGGRQ